MGDVKFLEHRRIDPDIANRWQEVNDDNFLGSVTWEVAMSLGYEQPCEKVPEQAATACAASPADDRFKGDTVQSRRQRRMQARDRRTG